MSDVPRIVLILGGTRSGKSSVAERIAGASGEAVTYLATGSTDSAGMDERIARHRARRPATWSTIECGAQLVDALRTTPTGPVLVDSLGTWLVAHHDFEVDVDALLTALTARQGLTVLVSEEVGLSVHPETQLGRKFIDAIGELNTAISAIADEVGLIVAGRTLWLPADDGLPS